MINQLFLDNALTVLTKPLLLGTALGVIVGVVIGVYESFVYRSPRVIIRVLWNTIVWTNGYAIACGIGTATIAYFSLYGFSLDPITSNYLDLSDNDAVLILFFLLPSLLTSMIGAAIGSIVGASKSSNYLKQNRSRH